jgi:hypothetical protein
VQRALRLLRLEPRLLRPEGSAHHTAAIKRLYSDARRAGFIGVSMWGGEPLLLQGLRARSPATRTSSGLATNMVSNGFLLEKKLDAVPAAHRPRVRLGRLTPSSRGTTPCGASRASSTRIVRGDPRVENPRSREDHRLRRARLHEGERRPALAARARRALAREQRVLVVFNALREEAATSEVVRPALGLRARPGGCLHARPSA